MSSVADIHPDWAIQRKAIELPNDLMGGTAAMRAKREQYLPKKPAEGQEDYEARLKDAALEPFFKDTVLAYEGQIFQKPVKYEDPAEGEPDNFDRAWFDAFYENVDLAGDNLSVYSKKYFRAALVDGVSFTLVDYSGGLKTRANPNNGGAEYQDKEGNWQPKTQASDKAMGLRPYFILIRAGQIIDVWLDVENGRQILKRFAYQEAVEVPKDETGQDREVITRIIVWRPNGWEKWEKRATAADYVMVDSGPNSLGYVPLAWLQLGDELPALTAVPPLADLAETNRAFWSASSDHNGRLMPFDRSPAAFGKCLNLPPDKPVPFGPARLITSEAPEADLKSVGVDAASVTSSQADLEDKREVMRRYGLQGLTPNVTATAAENSAVTFLAMLKGFCADLQDSLENALKIVANYEGWADGPGLNLNKNFRRGYDAALLAELRTATRDGIILPKFYVSQLLSMMPYSEEWAVDDVLNPDYGNDESSLFSLFGQGGNNPSVEGTKSQLAEE